MTDIEWLLLTAVVLLGINAFCMVVMMINSHLKTEHIATLDRTSRDIARTLRELLELERGTQ